MKSNRRCLFIASEVRSGSTFIAESLAYELDRNLGFELWGVTQEPFNIIDEQSSSSEILDIWGRLYLDGSGFSASKIMCKALSIICHSAENSDEIKRTFFGDNTYWVVIRRRDRIKQAISLAMAIKTGLYHYYGNPDESQDKDTELSNVDIENALRIICLSDIFLEVLTSRLDKSRLVNIYYEDFLADEVGCLNRIYAMCGFPPVEPETYINQAKLKPTAQESKRTSYEKFSQWFLKNYI